MGISTFKNLKFGVLTNFYASLPAIILTPAYILNVKVVKMYPVISVGDSVCIKLKIYR